MELKYTIVRSNRKSLAIEITRKADVLVRSPKRASVQVIDKFVSDHADWIKKHLAVQSERMENHPEPDDTEKAELIKMARERLPQKLSHYSKIMGLTPAGLTITGAKTRFGSCSGVNRISFSWRLMQYPDKAVDYVVVHELAHIVHKNHGREFYALIESVLPDYKERKKLLRM